LGLSFRKATFAQIGASPTKIPEYLAVGLPVVCNAGVGDVDELLTSERVGVVLQSFDDVAYQAAAAEAIRLAEDDEVRARCKHVARTRFDLNSIGGQRYRALYKRLQSPVSVLGTGVKAAL
jgi:glycosyltransferase involved in cell wall biosynthesis